MKVVVFYEKKFINKSFLISEDVSSWIQSCRLSDLSWNDYFVTRIYIGRLCKKWKKFNPKGFGNIKPIRKRRTIIFYDERISCYYE